MIIWFIIIMCIISIYWFQYPYINKKESKHKCINVFNQIKLPLFVICIIILIMIMTTIDKPTDLNIDLTPVNF